MSLAKLKSMLDESQRVVFFGGAGVSTESGIPDFRSEAGLFKTREGQSYPPERLLNHSFFIRYPDEFYRFYKSKMIYLDAKPNYSKYRWATSGCRKQKCIGAAWFHIQELLHGL